MAAGTGDGEGGDGTGVTAALCFRPPRSPRARPVRRPPPPRTATPRELSREDRRHRRLYGAAGRPASRTPGPPRRGVAASVLTIAQWRGRRQGGKRGQALLATMASEGKSSTAQKSNDYLRKRYQEVVESLTDEQVNEFKDAFNKFDVNGSKTISADELGPVRGATRGSVPGRWRLTVSRGRGPLPARSRR